MLNVSKALLIPTLLVVTIFFMQFSQVEKNKVEDKGVTISLKNTSQSDYADYLLKIPNTAIDFENILVMDGEKEVAFQFSNETLYVLLAFLKAGEEKQLRILEGTSTLKHKKRTQAELSVKQGGYFDDRKYIGGEFENIQNLRVPDEHTDHSYYIRYEGPGWESDLVGYRFYLDWRNATDIFGKKTNDVALHRIGQDGFDSYHEMQDWGMDILKVGKSLGIGSLAMFDGQKAIRIDETDSITCHISHNGPIYSAVETTYNGWDVIGNKYDVHSKISIHAGTRLSHHEIGISNSPQNLCTGIVKAENVNLYKEQGNDTSFGYLASYGTQSLNDDKLGLAIFFSNQDFDEFTEDDFSNIVKFKMDSDQLDYYFLAAWEGELNGIKDEKEFLAFLNKTAERLANPVEITIENN